MRIMEICSGAGVNGAANTCLQNILALLDRGHHVTLVCRPNAWIAEQLAGTTGSLEIVESELSRWPLHELRRIAALFFDRQHDVAHTHMSRANFFGVLLRRIFGVPCIATANNRYIQGHWMLNDHVLAASAATGRFHHRFNLVPNRKITVVHNFVEPTIYDTIQPDESSALRREWNVAADALLIGCLGDMIPRKGLLHLIGALPLIKQQIPNVCVAAFGREDPEYVAKIQAEIDRHDLHEQVRLVGYRSDIGQVLKACDVFALATLEDNLPLAILEAMACRLPVVSTHVGGIPECVEDGRTGFLVPAGNQSALAESLVKLLNDPALRSQFGQAGRQKLEAEFSPDTQTRLMEQVFARFARTQDITQPAASVRPSNEDPTYARAA